MTTHILFRRFVGSSPGFEVKLIHTVKKSRNAAPVILDRHDLTPVIRRGKVVGWQVFQS